MVSLGDMNCMILSDELEHSKLIILPFQMGLQSENKILA